MKPVPAAERVIAMDVLRGAALAGVLLVNLLTVFRVPISGHIQGVDEPLGWGGARLLEVMAALIEFKAFTLFSLLFGVGVAIQAGRATGESRTLFLLRRFGALLAIGSIHLVLIWNGDILTLYAVCGLLLVPLLRLRESTMAALGLLLIGAPSAVPLPVHYPDDAGLRALTAGAVQAYRSAAWPELLAFRWHETKLLIVPLLLLSFPRTLGLMLWGVAATLAGGVIFYSVQLAWSAWWLRHYHFGPFEWLWRSISYLRWQPFRRATGRTPGRS